LRKLERFGTMRIEGKMAAREILEIIARLSAATLVGAALGINRELHDKPAGLRTHSLVSLGAALVVVSSRTLAASVDHQADIVSRVVQGIVTGIGFLGAGVILRDPGDGHVQGLTTAAAIWVSALLGVSCGIGAYREVVIAFALVFAILLIGGPIERVAHRLVGQKKP
jgi:putative Mg2+ transporter-C (MgtC) family protein